ncbi:MAG: integrase [Flavobacteriaceae bacterium]|nr:MAG: integrase [Flavobacteriaceae bacterium]
MKVSFSLKNSKSTTATLIFFTCYFNKEKKQLRYSIRKSILPNQWDYKNNKPKRHGKGLSPDRVEITTRIADYEKSFYELKANCAANGHVFDLPALKDHFDAKFGNAIKNQVKFFEVYDLYVNEKVKRKEWKPATIKRYKNVRNLLTEFEKEYNYKLTFNRINNNFFTEFTDFCYEFKDHYTNTFRRNLSLVKTFMYWSLSKNYTIKKDFVDFKKPPLAITREEILTFEELQQIYSLEIEEVRLQKVRDVFIFQCLTGLRFGELKRINRRVVFENYFMLKELKDSTKPDREIPLFSISKEILEKYDFELPLISDQKQNDYIKEIFKMAQFNREVQFTRTKGVEQKVFVQKFYERVSTHTARRSFITIMRNKGVPDKTIMEISGHSDIKTFNIYHKVSTNAKLDAVQRVFGEF